MSVVCLCIGAAKAGTTWLHRQLSAHPECHFRSIKELHFFDTLENGKLDGELAKRRAQAQVLRDRAAAKDRTGLVDRTEWIEVLSASGTTADYLAYLREGAGEARVVGEMTPAYALLPEARLGEMARIAPDVRFLYLLRDPVERLWSHIRMIAARRDPAGQVNAVRTKAILRRTIMGGEVDIERRSDYAGTLARLAAAVSPSQVLVDVFEDVVQGNGLARICDFLGIARMTPNPAPVHKGQVLEMTAAQREGARAWLEPQYDAARRALGRMPEAWAMEGAR